MLRAGGTGGELGDSEWEQGFFGGDENIRKKKEPDPEGHTLYDPVRMKCLQEATP